MTSESGHQAKNLKSSGDATHKLAALPGAMLLAGLSLCFAPGALAQTETGTPSSAQAKSEDDVTSLKTVEVVGANTAEADPATSYSGKSNRSATGLQITPKETPQTVTVFTQKRMDDQNLDSVSDVLSQAPGISVREYDSARQYYFARGFEIKNLLIDGFPTMFDPGWGTGENAGRTAMYEQVELVKGATGLMTGSGNPGAAINLVRKRADSSEFKGYTKVGVGNRNKAQAEIDASSALNADKTIRARTVVSHEQADSFRDVGEDANSLVYATAEFDLSDRTLLTLGGSVQQDHRDGPTWGGLPAWYSDGTRTDYNRSKTTAADWTYWDTESTSLFAELSHYVTDDWQLNTRVNQGKGNSDSRLLYVTGAADPETGLGIEAYAGGNFGVDTEHNQIDVFATGKFAWMGRDHDASFGVSHSEREFKALSAYATSVAPIGNFNEWDGTGYPEHVWGERFLYEDWTDTQTAAYGSVRLQLTDRLTSIVGSRITQQEIDREDAAYNDEEVIKHDNIVIPYLGVLYALNDDYTAYASYTDIFSPQYEKKANGDPVDPIRGESQEIGLKGELLNDRLTATAAVFRTEQDNLAVADGVNTIEGSNDQAYKEAEGATAEGYELELYGSILDGWDLQAGWTAYELKDADGQKITPDQPRRIVKLFTSYQLPGVLDQVTVGGGVAWERENYADATNYYRQNPDGSFGVPERIDQDALTLVSLMARYQITQQLNAQLNVENVTDETYYTNIGTFGQYAYGTPRTVTISSKYDF